MSVLCDSDIRILCKEYKMIEPFVDYGDPRPEKVISYGLSSGGYDIRVADEYKIFTNVHSVVIDPKNFDPQLLVEHKGPHCIIPPNSFALARSFERFIIPRHIISITLGKSTYARCAVIANVTPFEPGWEGYATLEISNTTPCPVKIYSHEGLCQLMFHTLSKFPEVTYADRKGKYQNQGKEIVTSKVI